MVKKTAVNDALKPDEPGRPDFYSSIIKMKKSTRTKQIFPGLYLVTVGLIVSQLIVGCSTQTDLDDQLKPRTTDKVRLYEDGDYIEYDVTGTVTNTRYLRNGNNFEYPRDKDTNAILSCEPVLEKPPELQKPPQQPKLIQPLIEHFIGTLRVTWFINSSLQIPFTGGATTVNTMREESTLTLSPEDPALTPNGELTLNITRQDGSTLVLNRNDSSSSNDTWTWTSTRYISQDQETGDITLLSFPDNISINDYFWASTSGDADVKRYTNGTPVVDIFGNTIAIDIATLNSIVNPIVLNSPVSVFGDTDVDYFINSGCDDSAGCGEELRHYLGSQSFSGENLGGITTYFGRINPISNVFRGVIEDTSRIRTTVTELFDMRAFCSAKGNGSAAFNGIAWILPELGVVQYDNVQCIDPVQTFITGSVPTCSIDTSYDPKAGPPAGRLTVTEQRQWIWSAEIVDTNIPTPP